MDIRFRNRTCSFASHPISKPCVKHAILAPEYAKEARGRPHRMRMRPLDDQDYHKVILCDCDHSNYLYDSWRVRNYGGGPDKYFCRDCVRTVDGDYYKSQT